MQLQITLYGNETPEEIAKVQNMLGAYNGDRRFFPVDKDSLNALKESITGDVFGNRTLILSPLAPGESEALLEKLEAENPQFGQQPLPPGAGPLAPSGAPSPAAAETSASAPAAAPASIPPPPIASQVVAAARLAAATPVPAAAVDAKGLPWDERIHASSRAKIADGTWRMKRGVQEHVVTEVEAELRAQAGLSQSGSLVVSAGILAPPPPPAVPAPAPLPPGPPALTFGIVASRIGKAVTAGTLSGNVLSVKLAEMGFPDGLHTVNARPDMWQTVLDTLGA